MSDTLTREQKRMALDLVRLEAGDDDVWGLAMSHMFAVSEVLYHAGADLPWSFRDGARCPGPIESQQWPDAEYVPFLDAGELGIEMLTYAGRVLDRYSRWIERAGKSY